MDLLGSCHRALDPLIKKNLKFKIISLLRENFVIEEIENFEDFWEFEEFLKIFEKGKKEDGK